MKMKKSKIIVPALGLLLLSTAASVSGTVAWFTANRTYRMTAGEFAVVNTKDNLEATLGAGIGTSYAGTGTAITTKSGYTLTDASVDHTATTMDIVAPDDAGEKVASVTPLASADEAALKRVTNAHVYSAFTWTITFTMRFSANPAADVGLFLDLSSANTWVHESYKAKGDESVSGWYTDAALTTAATGANLTEGTTYYKAAPDDTGKAFRIAFVPTNIPTNSYGVTKVWAENQLRAKCMFIDGGVADNALENYDQAYSTATTKNAGAGATLTAETAGSDKVLMDSASTDAVPTSDLAKATCLSSNANYLGYFKAAANATVSLQFTCIAWYEGTDENIETAADTIYETVTTSMEFGVHNLAD